MREIKFRGKRIDNGEWVFGDLVRHYENQRRLIGCYQLAYSLTECGISRLVSENFHEVIPETAGQFTGLKDKNGKDIYEGDVVCWDGCTWTVCFFHSGFALINNTGRIMMVDALSFSLVYQNDESEICPDVEVIGNIHERMVQDADKR